MSVDANTPPEPDQLPTEPEGPPSVRIGGIRVTPAGGLGLAIFLASIVIVWLYGGGSARFETRVTRDPDATFDWNFVWEYTPDFFRALWVTTQATIGGFALAIVIGLVLALLRRSGLRLVRWPTAFFIEFVRSTPLLVQLFFLFYGLPRISWIPEPLRVWSSLATLIIALGVHYGTYCSEAYRAGIDSVPKGQWEAATAMNLGPVATWSQVVLPQAIPNVLPALGNFLIAAYKDAPLGYSINVTGVLFFARTIVFIYLATFEIYTMIGIGFLLVSIPSAYLLRRLERRIGYERT